jgi:hypothetical protein
MRTKRKEFPDVTGPFAGGMKRKLGQHPGETSSRRAGLTQPTHCLHCGVKLGTKHKLFCVRAAIRAVA